MAADHISIRALLSAEGTSDAVEAIRRRARALVSQATEMGWEGPPFDLHQLASLRGLKVEESHDFAEEQEACIVAGLVLLNAKKSPVRKRYSLAHEIAHTLFPDFEQELERVGKLWRRVSEDSEFEYLCQVAASEFLLPLDHFRAHQKIHGTSLRGVIDLAGVFEASVEATVRRTIDLADDPIAAAFLRPVEASTNEWLAVGGAHTPRAKLRVRSVASNPGSTAMRSSVGAIPPVGGAAERAWKRVSLARGALIIQSKPRESWASAGVQGLWDSEAVTLPVTASLPFEVLCLARLVRESQAES